jgi:hypothetical protein
MGDLCVSWRAWYLGSDLPLVTYLIEEGGRRVSIIVETSGIRQGKKEKEES